MRRKSTYDTAQYFPSDAGEIFEIEEKKIFAFWGGSSLDEAQRKFWHNLGGPVSWWPEEMPSKAEYENAWENLKKHDYKVHIILTHAGPGQTYDRLGVSRYHKEKELNIFLDSICSCVQYEKYYFAHLHIDQCTWRNQVVVYEDVRRI